MAMTKSQTYEWLALYDRSITSDTVGYDKAVTGEYFQGT